MAETIDVQYLQDKLAEMIETSEALVREHNDLLKVYKGLVNVGANESLGDLGTLDTLAEAPVGDLSTLQSTLQLKALSRVNTLAEAPVGNLSTLQSTLQVQNVAGRNVSGPYSDIMSVGFAGLGETENYSPTGVDIDDGTSPNGFWRFDDRRQTTGAAFPFSPMICGMFQTRTNDTAVQQIFIRATRAWFRDTGISTSLDPIEFLTSSNTTQDSNGNLRAASPIFRVANTADSAVGNGFVDAGAGVANAEAQGVTSEHSATGVYVISGSLGLARDNVWPNGYVIPQDANGNNLVYAEADQAVDGTITLRTYEPIIDENGKNGSGAPVDIPEGRWIDFRLEMAAQPGDEYPDEAPAPELTPEEQEQQRLEQLQRWRETTAVSAFQAHQAIADFELMDEVESYLARDNTPAKTRRAWLMAQEFRRLSPTVLEIAEQLGMTAEQLDEVFLHALTIEA